MGSVVCATSCTSRPRGWPTPCIKYFFTTDGSPGFCFLTSDGFGFLLPKFWKFAGSRSSRSRAQNAEDGVVNLLLPPAKTAAHRNRARQVGIVICVTGGDVEQQHFAFAAGLRIVDVVQ